MGAARREPEANPETDAELIAAARGGSSQALGDLYDRHARALLVVAFRLLQSADDAEDVVHDVFVGLPEALRRYQERGAFPAWLRKVTARVALARLRGAENVISIEGGIEPATQTRDVEGEISLAAAMRELSPSLRAVLVLKEIEGFSHAEVAQLLDISVSASEVRLHRAIRALRAILTKGEDR